jgi:membrane protease YdiL (CAAX protease family)
VTEISEVAGPSVRTALSERRGALGLPRLVLAVISSYLVVIITRQSWHLFRAVHPGATIAWLDSFLHALTVLLSLVIGGLAVARSRAPRRSCSASPVPQLLLALAVFPLPYVLSAVTYLILVAHGGHPYRVPNPVPHSVALSVALSVLDELALIAAAVGTASLLLNAAGRHLGDLGFGLSRRGGDTDVRLDAHRSVLVFVYGFGAPLVVVNNLLTLLPLPKSPPPAVHPTPAAFTAYAVAAAVSAGLCEEVVVLGFLVSQLERAGSRPAAVVAIAVLVRVSFHAYYGVFTLAFATWAVVLVLLYQRFRPRRLAPFIGAHVLWDLQGLLVAVLGNTALVVTLPALLGALALAWQLGKPRFLDCESWLVSAPPGGTWPASQLALLLPDLVAASAAALRTGPTSPVLLAAVTTAPDGQIALYVVSGRTRSTYRQRRELRLAARGERRQGCRQAARRAMRRIGPSHLLNWLWLVWHPTVPAKNIQTILAVVGNVVTSAQLAPPVAARRIRNWGRTALIGAADRVVTNDGVATWQAAQLTNPYDAGEWPSRNSS